MNRAHEVLAEFVEAGALGSRFGGVLADQLQVGADPCPSGKGSRPEDPVITRARSGRYYRANKARILQEYREAYAITEGAARRSARAKIAAAGLACKRCEGPVEVRGTRGRIPGYCGDKCRDAAKHDRNRERRRQKNLTAYHRREGAQRRSARALKASTLRCEQCRRTVRPKRDTGRMPRFCGKTCRYRAKYLRGLMAKGTRESMANEAKGRRRVSHGQ